MLRRGIRQGCNQRCANVYERLYICQRDTPKEEYPHIHPLDRPLRTRHTLALGVGGCTIFIVADRYRPTAQKVIRVAMFFSIFIALLTPATLAIASLTHHQHKRLQLRNRGRCVAHIAHLLSCRETPNEADIEVLRRRYSPSTLCHVLNFAIHTLRGDCIERIVFIGHECHLTINPIIINPDHAVGYIAEIERPLSLCEVAEATSTLLASTCPIAYTPLLSSRNRNLQLMGLYLVYHFGFVDAEHLVRRALNSKEPTIANLALHTLCSICGNMRTPSVVAHFEQITPRYRRVIMRHAVQSCYSPSSVAHLFTQEEQREFMARISSYKCSILC